MAAESSSAVRWLAGILIGAVLSAVGGLVRGHLEHERRLTAVETRLADLAREQVEHQRRIEGKLDKILGGKRWTNSATTPDAP